MESHGLFINGEFVPAASGETFESINPFNGQIIGQYARAGKADVDRAVAASRKAFDEGPWPRMPREERSRILNQIAEQIEAHARELTALEIADAGGTLRKIKTDVWLCSKQMGYFAKLALKDLDEPLEELNRPGFSQNWLVREPIGVCAQIIPWNFPLMMAIWKVGLALAAGNTVILKPAEETPATAMLFAKLLQNTELPPGVVNIITGFGEEAGEPLASHPDVDKVAFTGSTEIGKHIMHCAADTMKKVTLECGGKSANIILEDADLEMAVDGALYGAFYHAGQCCTAGSRILVQESIQEKFLEAFLRKANAIQLGDPADKTTDMGPLISRKQQERVLRYIELGKKEGARCAVGGGIPENPALANGFFVEPTVFVDVDNAMTIAQEEIFGPVVCIIPFQTPEEAVKIANDTIYGLAGAVWSRNESQAMAMARQLRAGTVWINEYHLTSEKAPFGGFKQSGLGRELGLEGLKEYTQLKHIHRDELRQREKKFWYDTVLAPKEPSTSS